MLELRKQFPKGFIDLPLFVHDMVGIPLQNAIDYCKKVKTVDLDDGIYLLAWSMPTMNPKQKASLLLQALHEIVDTQFSRGAFEVAWDEFNRKWEDKDFEIS